MKNNVLVVVDYQYDFVAPQNSIPFPKLSVEGADTIASFIQKQIDDPKYTNIIYTFDTHDSDIYSKSEEATMFPIHCEFGSVGWDLYSIIPRHKKQFTKSKQFLKFNGWTAFENDETAYEEMFFIKDKFSIFEGNKEYNKIVKKLFAPETTEFTIVGVAYDFCVNWHAQGLADMGYSVTVLTEGTKGISQDSMDSATQCWIDKNITIK